MTLTCLLLLLSGCNSSQGADKPAPDSLVIAHRGASGYLPESTLPAFALAYMAGSDYLEMDLVMSRDGVPVAFHDLELDSITNVAEVFPAYQREDGRWYVSDFSVDELRQLSVYERFEGRFPQGLSGYSIATFEEVLQLVEVLNNQSGCNVGIYPEIKHPKHHLDIGLPMEKTVVKLLAEYGYNSEHSKAYVQSFDKDSLIEIRYALQSDLKLVQLVGSSGAYDEMVTHDGLKAVSDYANAIGPSKARVAESNGNIVQVARTHGLQVHPYTFRADLVSETSVSFSDELDLFINEFGVNGVFTDHPDQVLAHLGRAELPNKLAGRCAE